MPMSSEYTIIVQHLLFFCKGNDKMDDASDKSNVYLKESKVKKCIYKSYDDLPLMLNAEIIKDVLGISISSAYELMRRKDFPSVRIGNRLIVPKDKLRKWIEKESDK